MRSYLRWEPEPFEDYASMMVFDALICNTDRHLTNFGVLRNSHTGDVLGMAPVFDNGRSLFFNLGLDQVGDFATEAQFVLPSWPQVTFEEQAGRLMGPRQKDQLQKLAAFEFANSEEHPFPGAFLQGLGTFARDRAEQLLELPEVSREELLARC